MLMQKKLLSIEPTEQEVMRAHTATPCRTAVFATAVVALTDVSDWFLTSSQAKKLRKKGLFDDKKKLKVV